VPKSLYSGCGSYIMMPVTKEAKNNIKTVSVGEGNIRNVTN